MNATGAKEVTFVVIAYNEEANVAAALRSISAQRDVDGYEVIVVDDASPDGTAAAARAYAETEDAAVRVISLTENRGRGHARWVGAREAQGRFVAGVDADIVLPPDWFARCRDALGEAHAVGGIAVPDGDVGYLHRRFGLDARPVPPTTEVTGNNALYRREVFESVGFDPDLREGEDIAINHAIRESGMRLHTLEDVLVSHEERKDLRASLRWLFQSGIGASRQLRRYRQVRVPDMAFAGWLASLGGAALLAVRGRHRAGLAAPVAYVAVASAAHIHTRFEPAASRPLRLAGATAVNAALLTAYFAGRAAGLPRSGR